MKIARYRRPALYLIAGTISYITEMVFLVVCRDTFQVDAVTAVAISFWIGTVIAFLLQKFIVFRNSELNFKSLLKQIGGYGALLLWNYAFTIGLTVLLDQRLHVVYIRTLAIVMIVCWNYLLYRSIFRQKEKLIV